MYRRASMIKRMDLVPERPGLLSPTILPVRLANQNKVSAPTTSLDLYPDGKTLVGSVQWALKVARPGLAQPLIVAKDDKQKALKETAKVVAEDQKMIPKAAAAETPAVAAAKNGHGHRRGKKPPAKPLSGWRFW